MYFMVCSRVDGCRLWSLLCRDLCHQALFLRPELGHKLGAKILGLKDLANLDFGFVAGGIRAALDPLDRLGERRALPKPIPGNEVLGFGERSVDHRPFWAREFHPRTLRAR